MLHLRVKNYLTARTFFICHAQSINWRLRLIKIHVEYVLTTNDLGIIVYLEDSSSEPSSLLTLSSSSWPRSYQTFIAYRSIHDEENWAKIYAWAALCVVIYTARRIRYFGFALMTPISCFAILPPESSWRC